MGTNTGGACAGHEPLPNSPLDQDAGQLWHSSCEHKGTTEFRFMVIWCHLFPQGEEEMIRMSKRFVAYVAVLAATFVLVAGYFV